MPFLPNLAELRGYANSLNPLNVFAEPPSSAPPNINSAPASSASTPTTQNFPASSQAGPGPSSLAAQQRSATLNIPSETRPMRPSLKNITSSDSTSIDDETTRRRISNTNVVILDPVDEGLTRRRGLQSDETRRRRTASTASGISSTGDNTTRRKKKTPLDTYIIVRPPPTSSKNPLNLQIQLVVKETRPRERSVSGVSLRSASYSTDMTGSGPTTPTSADIDLPSVDTTSLSSQSSPTPGSKTNQSTDSPTRLSADERDMTIGKSNGAGLRRSSSLKSSLSSNTTSTSGAAKKRVEPMFNLAVHNVMQPTVVTDAATDAKVAKFLKRTLDVNGVGILEPSEVWHPAPNPSGSPSLLPTASNEDNLLTPRSRPMSVVSYTSALSPTATRISENGAIANVRNSLDVSIKRTSMDLRNLRHEVGQEGGAKKFFGKIFKKKGQADADSSPSDPRRSISRRRSTSPYSDDENGHELKSSGSTMNGHEHHSHHGHSTFGTAPLIVRRRSSGTIVTSEGAITGLTAPALLSPPSILSSSPSAMFLTDSCTSLPMLPSTRPVGYTWTVKRWAKRNSEGWGAHLIAAAAAGLDMVGGAINGDVDDEVVFEWVKLRVPHTAVGSNIIRQLSSNGAVIPGTKTKSPGRKVPSRANSVVLEPSPSPSETETKGALKVTTPEALPVSLPASPNVNLIADRRPQPVRRLSATAAPGRRSASNPPSIMENDHGDTSSVTTHDLTAEEDSDPEDSETPWTCSVWVKNTGQRQLLGTLTPAPHHPKVIAALKIPRSLEAVSLAQVKPTGSVGMAQTDMAARLKQEVCLTEENLKDVVCVTAMWLVAREEFGGLGRKKRSSRA